MNAPSVDIKDLLDADSSLGLSFGEDLFISTMPDDPDVNESQCAQIRDTGGEPPEANYIYERPTIQIIVRGNPGEYIEAYDLITNIKDFLHAKTNTTQGGARYIAIWCSTDTIFLQWDNKNRPFFSVNFRIHRTIS